MLAKHRLLWVNLILALSLAGTAWARRVETARLDHPDFLSKLNLQFRGWKPEDLSLSPVEIELIEPDASLIRRFQAPNSQGAEIAVVAGHRKRSVHTPGFCMAGGGWETLKQTEPVIATPGGNITATRLLQGREKRRILTTFFFTDGDYTTNNLVQFQAVQLMKRFRAQIPLGAVVRVLVPVVGDDEESAVRLSDEFAQEIVPRVMTAIKAQRLHAE